MNTATRLSLLVVGLAAATTAALADRASDRICMNQARQDVLSCREQCTDEFRSAKLLCQNVQSACGFVCLGQRESCIETAAQPFTDCLGGCRNGLEDARGNCQDNCDSQACLDACVDQAQVTAFLCRDACSETFVTSGGEAAVDACRDTFRDCVRACPNASPAP